MYWVVVLACLFAVGSANLHVSGNKIYNSAGTEVKFYGVDHSGTEYACIQGWGIFDGSVDDTAITNMLTWTGINTVRVPLNEDCWLNINGVNSLYGGANYINNVTAYVDRLIAKGVYVIVELHWSAPGTTSATGQNPMPDTDHSITFWTSVASHFMADSDYVIYDVFNEPYPDSNAWDTTAAWTCWRDGGTCSGISYTVAGMQTLVNTIRATGATNLIMLGGIAYSNSLTQWITYKPTDTLNNIAAAWHCYNFNYCSYSSCWDSTVGVVAASYPVIAGEIGENDCAHGFIDTLMTWMDTNGVNYLGWTWNTWDCSSGPALISSYDGTATNFGVGLKNHLASL